MDYFDIIAGVLQGDTLAPFLFILILDYVLRLSMDMNNSKGLLIKPRTSRRHPAVHVTDLGYTDDLGLPSNALADAENLLHALEDAAAYVGLYCNSTKTEFISTDTTPHMCTVSGIPIKHFPTSNIWYHTS